MQRQLPEFVELARAHDQQPLVQVEVAPVKCERLADAQPRDGQETEQGVVGRRTQRRTERIRRR